MIITQNMLHVAPGDPFVHAFTFIIQFGAILSVVCLYWKQFFQMRNEQEFAAKMRFYGLLIVGVIPAVVIGLVAKKSGLLDWLLDSVTTVATTLVLGGVFMLRNDVVVYSNMLGKLAQCCFILALTLSFFHAEFVAWGHPLDRIVLWLSVVMTICALIDYAVGAFKTLQAKRAGQ